MHLVVTNATPERPATTRRLWGVSLHKEKRSLKAEAPELASWGEPWENVTHPFYAVRACLLCKQRHVGVRGTPQSAGRLYDSALWHLWGFVKNPKPRFNYLKPGDPAPELLPEVRDLQRKLRLECQKDGLDFDAMNYTFSQRNETLSDASDAFAPASGSGTGRK